MPKIYNEIVIDMNPESSTFEETLYEDSFEYSGDMMLMQGNAWEEHNVDPSTLSTSDAWKYADLHGALVKLEGKYYMWTPSAGYQIVDASSVTDESKFKDVKYTSPYGEYDPGTEGLPPMTNERWNEMNLTEKAQYILDTKYGGDIPNEENDLEYLKNKIMTTQPIKGEVDPTAAGFLAEQYGYGQYKEHGEDFGPGPDFIYGTSDDPGGIAGQTAGLEYGAAGRAFEGAGITYGAAGRTYETAGIQKETMLGGLQESASQVGAPGVGMRSKIAGKEKIQKGFETGMDIYDIAGETYTAAGETYGLAGETYGAAREAYGLAEETAGLDYRRGMYDLETDVTGKWESDWSTFWSSLPDAV